MFRKRMMTALMWGCLAVCVFAGVGGIASYRKLMSCQLGVGSKSQYVLGVQLAYGEISLVVWSEDDPARHLPSTLYFATADLGVGLIDRPSDPFWRRLGFNIHLGRIHTTCTIFGGVLPWWAIEILAGIPAYLIWRNRRRAALSARIGLCQKCGYDLRASPGACPECGTSSGSSSPEHPTTSQTSSASSRET